jgi:hypothetical protein
LDSVATALRRRTLAPVRYTACNIT